MLFPRRLRFLKAISNTQQVSWTIHCTQSLTVAAHYLDLHISGTSHAFPPLSVNGKKKVITVNLPASSLSTFSPFSQQETPGGGSCAKLITSLFIRVSRCILPIQTWRAATTPTILCPIHDSAPVSPPTQRTRPHDPCIEKQRTIATFLVNTRYVHNRPLQGLTNQSSPHWGPYSQAQHGGRGWGYPLWSAIRGGSIQKGSLSGVLRVWGRSFFFVFERVTKTLTAVNDVESNNIWCKNPINSASDQVHF